MVLHGYFRNNLLLLFIALFCSFKFQVTGYKRCPRHAQYRTFDGSCNNLRHPSWGKAGIAQRRFIDKFGRPMVDYEDGTNEPRGYPHRLPSPRLVSNMLVDEKLGPENQFDHLRSVQSMAYAQILAHDLVETQLHSGIKSCCNKKEPKRRNLNVCFPYSVPKDDHFFPSGCKHFVRAVRATEDYDLPEYREQINQITAYIDASFVYGSDLKQAISLWKPDSYLLKTYGQNDLLPVIDGGSCLKKVTTDKCTLAGDDRNGEVPNLGLNHMIWVREHNYIAEQLHIINPHWNNEKVFQETRRIIIALLQHITYNHFLPVILDDKTMDKYRLYSKTTGYDRIYNNKVDASIFNVFGIAPFRYGHSQIPAHLSLLHKDYKTIDDFNIENLLQSPHLLEMDSGKQIPNFARFLSAEKAMKIDNLVIKGIRDKLFFKSSPPGDDLVARNLQRGRDHGVPGYNKWREFCGLSKFTRFRDFGKFARKLAYLYRYVDDVDLFIGGLTETGPNGRVGPTFACIIGKQFHYSKFGDRYWYESDDPDFDFTLAQLNNIKKQASFAKIYCRNSDLLSVQSNVFLIPSRTNPITHCDDLPDIDLSLWKDRRSYSFRRRRRHRRHRHRFYK